MAKGQTGAATSGAKSLISQGQELTAPVQQGFQSQSGQAQQNRQDVYSTYLPALKQNITTGGYDPNVLPGLRSQAGTVASTGGFDPGTSSTLQQKLAGYGTSSAYDPTALQNIRDQSNAFISSGGFDPTAKSTIEQGYTDFANTGGFTEADKNQFLNRATSGVTNTYDILGQQALQSRAKTGGLGTGGDYSQLARQLGQAQADATLGAQTSLSDQIRQGKLAGLGGLTGEQEALSGLKQTALSGLRSTEADVAASKLAASGQERQQQADIAGGIRSGTALQQGLEGDVASGNRASVSGLGGLYNEQTGEITSLGNQILQTLGLNFGTQEQGLAILANLSKNPGAFQTGFGDFLNLAGVASGFNKLNPS
jgi:hypothetical protein